VGINGQIITRSVGFGLIRLDKYFTVDEIVFAQKGDLLLLGARTLEGLNLTVDSRRKKLVASGPLLAGLLKMNCRKKDECNIDFGL
jgi:predicted aspartyl protease